uniref:Uncharacterized protein n=1 Tax=Zea mays TaxID=4577 RepID=C0PBP7_MAIZE|nr:unknown [Zea mays]
MHAKQASNCLFAYYLEHEATGGVRDGLDDDGRPRQVTVTSSGAVARGAVGADLSLGAREHVDLPHLDVGVDELVEEGVLVDGEARDDGARGSVGQQVLVRREEALPVEQVHVVLVVEGVGRADVVGRRVHHSLLTSQAKAHLAS